MGGVDDPAFVKKNSVVAAMILVVWSFFSFAAGLGYWVIQTPKNFDTMAVIFFSGSIIGFVDIFLSGLLFYGVQMESLFALRMGLVGNYISMCSYFILLPSTLIIGLILGLISHERLMFFFLWYPFSLGFWIYSSLVLRNFFYIVYDAQFLPKDVK